MLIARFSVEARFGHKQDLINSFMKWSKEIAPEIGWSSERVRLLDSSIGGLESTISTEVEVEDLASLEKAWQKLAEVPAHKRWGKEMEAHIVSGTNRWEVFRIVE